MYFTLFSSFIYGFVALGMAQMIPTYGQLVYGFSSDMAALIVLIKGVGWFLCGLVIAALMKRIGYWIPLILIIALIAICYFIYLCHSSATSA